MRVGRLARPRSRGVQLPAGTSVTPEAAALIAAAGITDPTQQAAINTHVIGLKADGLWVKMPVVYLNVGGSQNSCKYNLKDPRDLDAAFRKTYFGSNTFASTGVTSDGSTGYANTHYSPAANGVNNSISIGVYSRTNSAAANAPIGCGAWFASGNAVVLSPTGIAGPGNAYSEITGTGGINIAVADSLGLWTATRTNSTTLKLFQNASELSSNATASVNISGTTDEIYIHARNSGGAANFSPLELAYEFIGIGLTDVDVANLSTHVQAFQTSLGRQV